MSNITSMYGQIMRAARDPAAGQPYVSNDSNWFLPDDVETLRQHITNGSARFYQQVGNMYYYLLPDGHMIHTNVAPEYYTLQPFQ